MFKYSLLKEKPKEFLTVTGLMPNEFERLLPVFSSKLATLRPLDQTQKGKQRQRKKGGGTKGKLQADEDKLLFILEYQKTYPLQTIIGLQYGLSQPQANYWIHHLMPVLQETLRELGLTPERDPEAIAKSPLLKGAAPDFLIDGTERRRQRPKDSAEQVEHYSGKKKAHTDKNLLLVSSESKKVIYLSSTVGGQTHDKKMADENPIRYPNGATLGKDTGFQGYEPEGVITFQPKKSRKGKS